MGEMMRYGGNRGSEERRLGGGMEEWMAMEERLEEWCVKVRGVGSVGASGVTRELGREEFQYWACSVV